MVFLFELCLLFFQFQLCLQERIFSAKLLLCILKLFRQFIDFGDIILPYHKTSLDRLCMQNSVVLFDRLFADLFYLILRQ